jgi:hypothetical protein
MSHPWWSTRDDSFDPQNGDLGATTWSPIPDTFILTNSMLGFPEVIVMSLKLEAQLASMLYDEQWMGWATPQRGSDPKRGANGYDSAVRRSVIRSQITLL